MGGFNTDGFAWRIKLPEELLGIFSINLLEFIASAIKIYLTLKWKGNNRKFLAFTDSYSALGWLHKVSFANSQPAHDKVARWMAECLINHDSSLYLQHIKGKHILFADCLSHDHHISNARLTASFFVIFPNQLPLNFKIVTMPKEIILLLHSLSHTLTSKQVSPKQQQKTAWVL